MNVPATDVPGAVQALAACEGLAARLGIPQPHAVALAMTALQAATPHILAAGYADAADDFDILFPGSQAAAFLDSVGHHIREQVNSP